MDKYIGKRLDGRYEIKEMIGVGGMAYVYKAYDSIDDRVVAVKILKEEFLANEEFTRRFKNESKAIAILSHPNIVRVLDVSFGEKMQYIVMEYIDGITLKEYIDQKKALPWKEAVHFTVQVLRALQHAHDKGIIHRDIKPQNIMLLADGTIKVTDFGIAQFSRNDIRTGSDRAIGSVHYISPEQASGGLTDEKADIYSLGILLYEMLTGKLPFEADNAVSVAIMQMQAVAEKPRDINDSIPEGLEEITLKAMHKDPMKRYQSAAEMLYDIDEFKRNPSIHFEYTYFVDETPTRFVEAISKVRGESDEDSVEQEEEEPRKGLPVLPILAAVAAALVLIGLIFAGVTLFFGIINPDNTKDSDKITIPELIGKEFVDQETFLEAYPELKSLNLTVLRQWNDSYAENQIVSTNPKKGKKLEAGDQLEIVVSRGPHMVQVPEVPTNDTADNFIVLLQNAKFEVTQVLIMSESVEKGCVVRTSPAYPEMAPYGSTITVFVSNGTDVEDTALVPNVDQLTEEAAKIALEEAGFVVGTITKANHATYEAGRVTAQDPPANTEQATGTPVNLVLASGYRNVSIPLQLPETSSKISFEVFLDGKLQPSYSGVLQNILPSVVPNRTMYVEFSEERETYRVSFGVADANSEYKIYASYTVNGLTGQFTQDTLNMGLFTTTAPNTTTQPTAAPTDPVTDPTTVPDAGDLNGTGDSTDPAELE